VYVYKYHLVSGGYLNKLRGIKMNAVQAPSLSKGFIFSSNGLDEEYHDTGSRLKRWIKRYNGKSPQFA